MIDPRGPFRIGATFFAISAIIYICAFLAGGLTSDALGLIPVGILYLAIAYGLFRGWRWLGYLAFVIALIGGIIAFWFSLGAGPVPSWWWALIAAANLGAALSLFAALWRAAPTKAATS